MKKESTITSQLGITQNDAAHLLGISRSQWSMFESGKRDLPLAAKLQLNEMLAHVSASGITAKSVCTTPQKSTLQRFERLLRKNEYRLYMLDREIETAEKKYLSQARLQQLSGFLSNRPAGKSKVIGHHAIAGKTTEAKNAVISDALAILQHRREILAFEKQLLESKLQQLQSGIANSKE